MANPDRSKRHLAHLHKYTGQKSNCIPPSLSQIYLIHLEIMGRTEPSTRPPPAAARRDARAKRAKATINQVIPSLLTTHPRAKNGIDAARLIVDIPPNNSSSGSKGTPGGQDSARRNRLMVADTLTAARRAMASSEAPGQDVPKTAILNMASPLSPGGGFLNGASSQEESLCMRTTLLPSLKDEYYRLPELGAIFSPDIMVFRDEDSYEILPKGERWFVHCISAAMLRNPELDHDDMGRATYANDQDRHVAMQKMRMVMRICEAQEIKKVVLGAWGCGAYGNPINEIAAAWKKVLMPRRDPKGKAKKETWPGVEEVIFAIKDPGMASAFAVAFGDGLEEAEEEDGEEQEAGSVDEEELGVDDQESEHAKVLARIEEMRQRLARTA
ncbi:hypothetical protein B0I35DRAFT_427447 [Stachybotrys elegans]|uniref:Microbial-type PARG catalytic domain-containing protein n=1 Tax=Stachybotrys elegans TaxID=80388 RepID=A0A8K0SYM8_9HYPO|nr:hypothetical protein B0I35DRAFT_427447 [Stachybotrys elegans]